MKRTDKQTIFDINEFKEPEFIEATFEFWFNTNDHIRSPFPEYIRTGLKEESTQKFLNWLNTLPKDAHKDINEEIVVEKFEELIFNAAIDLVKTEDEKITILYPFLPRLDDVIKVKEVIEGADESKVIARSLENEGDDRFLKVQLKTISSGKEWGTRFELPQ